MQVNQKMMKSTLIKDLYGEIDRLKAGIYGNRFLAIVLAIDVIFYFKHGISALLALFCRGLCCEGEKWSLHTKGEILSRGKRKEGKSFNLRFQISNIRYL